ncbi:TetR/AcrR family transcriptional regulator [Chryseobacterium carnipullorum]|uniref:TetR/AcrR family transcriptional regulator n=1 Tax=Chryseobacterium carnipullorum TaxID=1124835 RepID=A0A1M7MZI1_CHRCU|nr:TetR/AcrR family transcriptional regulator [Chryseobacterium carnipullorum]MDN5423210.1 TetR/AcrR family transcriptional regulator [Chryseobacterium sp.]AZA48936.1 TetR/AcrR family transcriptional regulator [Chryseobacterium carnipullorum]AZA63835.1 TetR/AcrR family transcriptional regulator [Chryseobacterium carnipullorum]MDN5479094.1 TetR/AcrR family transcriptional regulator [Chryseobacterium sp.]MDN5481954.1 TetR/AcrR family transcriptional regulator [Chryseobacterium sp.]
MAGRPKIFNEQEAVAKATEVFRDKGYDTASAEELLGAMGIGKGSFYLAFKGGKQELYVRSITQFSERFYQKLSQSLAASEDKIQLIKDFFISLAYASDCDKERGCYLGNALVQLSEKDQEIKKVTAQLLKELQSLFAKTIRRAQEKGEMNSTEDPEIIGWHLSNLWNGIHVTRRMESSPEILKSIIEMNLKILD